MKTSPLCSRDNGREITFTAKLNTGKVKVVCPGAVLDAACGPDANETTRKAWVETRTSNLVAALVAQTPVSDIENGILVEEIA